MEELKRFENGLKTNGELRKKLEETFKRIANESQAENDGEITVKAAKELGYDISIAELEKAAAEAEPLDIEELEQVSGGYKEWCMKDYGCEYAYNTDADDQDDHNPICIASWHCLTAFMHTEGGTKYEACWRNYCCFGAYI